MDNYIYIHEYDLFIYVYIYVHAHVYDIFIYVCVCVVWGSHTCLPFVQYPTFYSQNNFDVGSAIAEQLLGTPIAYLSSPEVGFLKDVQNNLTNSTEFILKFWTKDEIEPSTKQSYGSLLNNLTTISAFASGILVPKDYIWSVNNDSGYLVSDSGLISKAHNANLYTDPCTQKQLYFKASKDSARFTHWMPHLIRRLGMFWDSVLSLILPIFWFWQIIHWTGYTRWK